MLCFGKLSHSIPASKLLTKSRKSGAAGRRIDRLPLCEHSWRPRISFTEAPQGLLLLGVAARMGTPLSSWPHTETNQNRRLETICAYAKLRNDAALFRVWLRGNGWVISVDVIIGSNTQSTPYLNLPSQHPPPMKASPLRRVIQFLLSRLRLLQEPGSLMLSCPSAPSWLPDIEILRWHASFRSLQAPA
jgi:hypothetical protein